MNDTKYVDKKIKEAADAVVVNLAYAAKKMKEEDYKPQVDISTLLDLEELMEKDINELTSRERIVGFFQAAIKCDQIALKALAEGVSADGGYLVPDEFRAEVIRDLTDGNYMRSYVTVLPMKRMVMQIPTLESRPKVTWTQENTTKETTTCHFDQATLTAFKMAAILYASDELIEDSDQIDIVKFIITLFSEVIGEEEDRVIWRGNGTTQPTGIVTVRGAGGINTRTAVGGLNFDNIIDLMYDLPGKYHKNAKFFIHRQNIRDMRKLKDSAARYYWQEPLAVGQPATFYGYPVIETNDIPSDEIYFGDLKRAYWLGDKGGMAVKVSQDTTQAFQMDQTAIRVTERIAGNVVLALALRCLNGI